MLYSIRVAVFSRLHRRENKFPPATPHSTPAPHPTPLQTQNALNLADMRYGLAAEELEVGEIFVTKGKVVKRMRIMGRGRAGISR